MNAEVRRIQNLPEIREKLGSQSTTPLIMAPQELGKWLAGERDRWAQVIKTSGFKIE
jgi:tripartite-type tricarboxylate transporter receptor subunit TctC